MNISYSRVASWMTCPYQHYLRYEVGVKKNQKAQPLYFGSDFHKLLETRKDADECSKAMEAITDKYYTLPADAQSKLGADYLENLFRIFAEYCSVYGDESLPTSTEVEFSFPMFTAQGEPYYFMGKIDEVYKRKDKKTGERYVKLGEHKTFSRRPTLETLAMNTQKFLYAKACYFLYGMFPRVVIWDYISSKPAPCPVWVMPGKFSAAARNTATPYSFRLACSDRGITDPEILAQADEYKGNIEKYFFRVNDHINPETVEKIWHGFEYQARLIADLGKYNKTKNLCRNCSYCEYKDICYTELTEGNVEYTISKDYKVFERKDIETGARRVRDDLFQQFTEVPAPEKSEV